MEATLKRFSIFVIFLFSFNAFSQSESAVSQEDFKYLNDVRTYWTEYLAWKKKIMGNGKRFIGRGFKSSVAVDHNRFYGILETTPERVPMDLIKTVVEQGYPGQSDGAVPPEWYMRAYHRLKLNSDSKNLYSDSDISINTKRAKELFEKLEMAKRKNKILGKPVIDVSIGEPGEFVELSRKYAKFLQDDLLNFSVGFISVDNGSEAFESYVTIKLELLNRSKLGGEGCSKSFSNL